MAYFKSFPVVSLSVVYVDRDLLQDTSLLMDHHDRYCSVCDACAPFVLGIWRRSVGADLGNLSHDVIYEISLHAYSILFFPFCFAFSFCDYITYKRA